MKRKLFICAGLFSCLMISACAHSMNPNINNSQTITDNSRVTIDNSVTTTTTVISVQQLVQKMGQPHRVEHHGVQIFYIYRVAANGQAMPPGQVARPVGGSSKLTYFDPGTGAALSPSGQPGQDQTCEKTFIIVKGRVVGERGCVR